MSVNIFGDGTITGISTITFDEVTTEKINNFNYPTQGPLGNRNLIINGAMEVDQRNSGSSITPTGNGEDTLDRWKGGFNSDSSKYSIQQKAGIDTTASNYEANSTPAGFNHSLKVTSLSAFSIGSSSQFQLGHYIEDVNTVGLGYGTSSAVPLTLSFWVKSSISGTFAGSFRNPTLGNPPSNYRTCTFSYSINSTNTWEKKVITIPGDTSFQTGENAENIGFTLAFTLGTGSNFIGGTDNVWVDGNYLASGSYTNIVATDGATFYLTGVQLEVGERATPFEHRSYGQELTLCQRYYQKVLKSRGSGNRDAGNNNCAFSHKIHTMRATPDCTFVLQGSDFNHSNKAFVNLTPNHVGVIISINNADSYWFYNHGYEADAEL